MSALKDPRQHDDLLNYQLKRLLRTGGAPAIRLCEGGYGITRQEWRLAAALVEAGPMSVGDLGRHAHLESGAVSRGVSRLTRKGLVARTAVAGDARRAMVEATEDGRGLYAALMPQLAAINRRLMEVLSEEESVLLQDLLARLTRHAAHIESQGGGVALKTGRHLGGSRRAGPAGHASDVLARSRLI
jgi:DNA-binding MarR family transcriptional regulator